MAATNPTTDRAEFSLFTDDDLPEDDFDAYRVMKQIKPWPKGVWFANVDEDDE